MVTVGSEKKQLRRAFREIREGIHRDRGALWGPQELAVFEAELGAQLATFRGPVLSFFPMGSEPSLLPSPVSSPLFSPQPTESDLAKDSQEPEPSQRVPSWRQRDWYFPAVSGQDLLWFDWQPPRPLPPRLPSGLQESPDARDLRPQWLSTKGLCFVPALAVDQRGMRLGYGGGYYDRFFSAPALRENFLLVSCLHPDLMPDRLPAEEHDVHIDLAVTSEGIHFFGDRHQMLRKLGTTS